MNEHHGTHHKTRIRLHDVTQIVVGACILGFPVAVSEDVWNLGKSLPWTSMLPIVVWSVFFLGAFIFYQHYRGDFMGKRGEFVERVLISYGITLVCCAMTLALVDKFPLLEDPEVAVKCLLLVAFPASFAATVVDSMS